MFGDNRLELRRQFTNAWAKASNNQEMTPLERMIAEVVALHPEYHGLIESGEDALDRDFAPEDGQTNPFLHMAMHISIHEQLSTDRPAGIRSVYQQLQQRLGDNHEVEHQMMECLGLMLWQAQRDNRMPDEQVYLAQLKKLAGVG